MNHQLVKINRIPHKNFNKNAEKNESYKIQQIDQPVTFKMKTFLTFQNYLEVQVGNPPQNVSLVFDTGSSDVVITSTKCNSFACWFKTKYNSEKSSSYKDLNETVVISYVQGNITMNMAKDDFHVFYKFENYKFN